MHSYDVEGPELNEDSLSYIGDYIGLMEKKMETTI